MDKYKIKSVDYIYVLRCPDTKVVRYVGRTKYPSVREYQHSKQAIKNPKSRVQAWLKSLREMGKCPIFEIIERSWNPKEREKEWIRIYREKGNSLLNVVHNR